MKKELVSRGIAVNAMAPCRSRSGCIPDAAKLCGDFKTSDGGDFDVFLLYEAGSDL